MTWHDGLRDTATDGTELAHVRRMWETDHASAHLGIEVLDIDRVDGLARATARMTITESMVNGHGTTHGGMVFTFCDSVFALTANACGVTTVAAHCAIDFLAPTRLGDVLVGVGEERFAWGRSAMTDVVVRRAPDAEHTAGTELPADLEEWPVVAVFSGRSRTLGRR